MQSPELWPIQSSVPGYCCSINPNDGEMYRIWERIARAGRLELTEAVQLTETKTRLPIFRPDNLESEEFNGQQPADLERDLGEARTEQNWMTWRSKKRIGSALNEQREKTFVQEEVEECQANWIERVNLFWRPHSSSTVEEAARRCDGREGL